MKRIKPRLAFTALFFLLMFLAVGWRAFHLQILQGEKLKRLGERQHLREWIVLPKRGTILDRAGEPLALSLEAQSIYARPRRIKEPESIARTLAQLLGLDSAEVQKRLRTKKPFAWIKRQVTPKEAERIRALNLKGVGMYYEPDRYYPQGQLAGQVIGFVGMDSQGLEGIELYYDAYIRGETGSSVIERDGRGRRVLVQGVEELQIPPGADIHLTLDTSIQHLVERELEAAVSKFQAKAGIAVVVEPFSGEVLALANYPFFNPNSFTRYSSWQWRNRAVTDSFEPGSTFKAILAAAALEEGIVGKEDLFYCEFGKYFYAGKIIHDSHKYGWLPFYKIIQYSSNIGATKVAEKLKKERYFKYIKRFGFGRLTGIDMPGEVAGTVRPLSEWSPIALATHSFGQGIAVTPIQLVMAYGAIANGGFLMQPFVVRRVVGPDGKVLVVNQAHVVRRVVSEKTARLLTSILKAVVSDGGTGVMASVEGFEVAGKTGTAQKPDLVHGGYAANKRIASFIGFVPADDPRLVLLVLVDEPEVNVYGGVVAAPVFRNIARGVLRHLGVVPEGLDALPMPAAKEWTLARGDRRNGVGTVKRENAPGVPDFVGLSLREAVGKARALKLKVKMRGNGYVVKQSPAPGVAWGTSETLTLNFRG
ncbi:MAG: penicillin-binding transpeptidase domain-containing protein [Deltaproteobacteria bacterium]|nr:penicillin-binding transpeptidase domain-containing protein [Deltaproteobacteria bacterium]